MASQRVVTSQVFKGPGLWYEESYLIPHEPLRWDLDEASRLLDEKYFDGTAAWKVDNFFKWYEIFSHIVHHHHDAEEQIAFPILSAKAQVPPKMTNDHKGLMNLMDQVKNVQQDFQKANTDAEKKAAATKLRTTFNKLRDEMVEHLAEEERVLTPIVRDNMTQQEHDEMVTTILQTLGLSGNKIMLPWILHAAERWAGPEFVQHFRKNIPLPIILLNDYIWTSAYERDNWGLLHSLEKDTPPESSWWSSFF